MANPTMTLISSNTVGSGGVASVTFSSIPATYTDLMLCCSARSNASGVYNDVLLVSLNGITTNFSSTYLQGNGTGVETGTLARLVGQVNGASSTANTYNNSEIYFPNYLSNNTKSYSVNSVVESNNSGTSNTEAHFTAGLWSYTGNPAINSITLTPNTGTLFVQYSTFYLYGIKNS